MHRIGMPWKTTGGHQIESLNCCFLLEEVTTVPFGPEETAEQWRSSERLAISCLGVKVWARGFSRMFTVLCRCLEKGPAYPLAVLDWILGQLPMRSIHTLELWQDGPTSWKNRYIIGTLSYHTLSRFVLRRVGIHYGCPKHFKEQLDSHFAGLVAARKRSCRTVTTIAELAQLYRDHFNSQTIVSSHTEVVVEFALPTRASVEIHPFLVESCMGIAHNYSWVAVRNDRRRDTQARLHGQLHNWTTLTGLTLRCSPATGVAAGADRTCMPVLDLAAPVPDSDDLVLMPGDMPVDISMHSGWRCSYMRHDHTHTGEAAERRRLHLQRQAARSRVEVQREVQEPRRHRAVAVAAKAAAAAKQHRSDRGKRFTAAMQHRRQPVP